MLLIEMHLLGIGVREMTLRPVMAPHGCCRKTSSIMGPLLSAHHWLAAFFAENFTLC